MGIDLSAYDLAPNYIGPLTATVFIMSAAASILAPYTVGLFAPHVRIRSFFVEMPNEIHSKLNRLDSLQEQSYASEWRTVFWSTFVIYILGATTYLIWGSSEVQPWNFPRKFAENMPIYN